MTVRYRPRLGLLVIGWLRAEPGADLVELRAVARRARFTQGRGVGDRVKLEVVDIALELERDHLVHEARCGDSGFGCSLRVQAEQPAAGAPDDAARVVGPGDHLDSGRRCLVS